MVNVVNDKRTSDKRSASVKWSQNGKSSANGECSANRKRKTNRISHASGKCSSNGIWCANGKRNTSSKRSANRQHAGGKHSTRNLCIIKKMPWTPRTKIKKEQSIFYIPYTVWVLRLVTQFLKKKMKIITCSLSK